jgi:hypothetical protein
MAAIICKKIKSNVAIDGVRKSGSEIRVGNPGEKSGSEMWVRNPDQKSGPEIQVRNPERKSG